MQAARTVLSVTRLNKTMTCLCTCPVTAGGRYLLI